MYRFTFGKHKGKKIKTVAETDYEWLKKTYIDIVDKIYKGKRVPPNIGLFLKEVKEYLDCKTQGVLYEKNNRIWKSRTNR